MNAAQRALRAIIITTFTLAGIAWGLTNALIGLANSGRTRR